MVPADGQLRSVIFYCPDAHIQYDGRTPYEVGVGGGITARVRMARALARIGHRVRMVVNCSRIETIDGVDYLPLVKATALESDVIILNTSGGELDLSSVHRLGIRASLVLLWASGLKRPRGLDGLPVGFVYAKSNFQRDVVRRDWDLPDLPIFVSYNGFDEEVFRAADVQCHERDPFRLISLAHPLKGLAATVQVLRRLRQVEPRYVLHVFGDERLWGDPKGIPVDEPGVVAHGLVGQRQLAVELLRSSFALHLQTIQEVFGIALLDSLRAGCLVLASEVGAYPELVHDGLDGYLVPGDPNASWVQDRAAERVLECGRRPLETEIIRGAAKLVPWSMDRLADAWTAHWTRVWEGSWGAEEEAQGCAICGGVLELLPDGEHCTECGQYSPLHKEAARSVGESRPQGRKPSA